MKTPVPVVVFKQGDKITAAAEKRGHGVFLARGVVHTVLPKGVLFAQLKEKGAVAHNVYLNIDDEGITWIRGYHAEGDLGPGKLLEEARRHFQSEAAAKALDR